MRINVAVQSRVSTSPRARQLEGMFDVPRVTESKLNWSGDMPIEDRDWNVGLIVGPSGAGKSTIAADCFGLPDPLEWHGDSVVDDFAASLSMQDIADVCGAVGFNTIPAWLRPYGVLSTGEKFRVDLARRLAEAADDELVLVDEFTSTVDRQVAKIGSHAVQKYVRRAGRRFVAVTCHYDVIDWLQPDWVLEPHTMEFRWRSVQPRPALDVTISPVPYSAWRLFAPYHYMSASLHPGARCWGLFVDDEPAAFAGVLHRPHPKAKNLLGVSRLVTLPDWQGVGLAFVLLDYLGGIYKAIDKRLRMYPAHPALIRSMDRSRNWALKQRPGQFGPATGSTSQMRKKAANVQARRKRLDEAAKAGGRSTGATNEWHQGSRPCAVFEYAGPAHQPTEDALDVLRYHAPRSSR